MPINDLIILRKGPETEWSVSNPVLASGEPGYDSTNNILKIGDGIKRWASLDSVLGSGAINYNAKWDQGAIGLTTGIIYDNGDRVGIGTSAPTSTLHIRNNNNTALQIQSLSGVAALDIKHNNSGLYGYIGFDNDSHKYSFIQHNGSATTSYGGPNALSIYNYAGPVILGASASNTYEQNIVINTDGNVGIGTDSPSYKLDVNGTFSADSINVNDQFTFPTTDGSSGQTLVTNGSGVVSWSSAGSNNLTRGSFDLTQSSGTFNVDGGYNVGTLDVYYNGIKLLSGTDYTATNGTSFTLTNVATSGDVVEYVALNASTSAVGNTALGSVTATNSQSVFNVTNGYTAGGLAVFLNGVKLIDGTDFTATNGTSFTLTSPASSGDIVDYIAYGAVVASSNLQKTGDTMTGNLTIGNGSDLIVEGDLIVAKYKEGFVDGGNSSTSKTIDITSGTLQTVTLTDNCTFTMPSVEAGRSFTLLLKTGTGSFTSTFTGVKWPSDSAPTITTTASKLDILTFVSDGTNWYGNISQNYSV